MTEPEVNYIPLDLVQKQGGEYNTPTTPVAQSNIIPTADGTVMNGGMMRSSNYVAGVSGWSINSDGNVEFGNGKFRGEITANKITAAGLSVVVSVGDSIQDAIDEVNAAGGGKVLLESGTHTVNSDLTLYSNITIEGQTSDSTYLDFNSTASSIIVQGSNVYTTGTLSINNGSTTVTGSGTTWTSAMIGRYIMIGGLWYPISGRTSNTEITIGLNYIGPNLSGESYTICTPIYGVYIQYFIIKNSLTNAIEMSYGSECWLRDLSIQSSVAAIDINNWSQMNFDYCDSVGNASGFNITNTHYSVFQGDGSMITSVGAGWTFTNCTNLVVLSGYITGSATDGVQITGCSQMGFLTFTFNRNGSQGAELISGNNNIVFQNCGFVSNASDGIKLTATSDNCLISGGFLNGNGGYGINIADSTCDTNDVRGNRFSSNVSGEINDSGTGTLASAGAEYLPGTVVLQSADTPRNTASATYAKLKEFSVAKDGTLTTVFDGKYAGVDLDTDFTETDGGAGGGTISLTDTKATFTALTRNEITYVYKDFTAGYFSGDFSHQCNVQATGSTIVPSISPLVAIWGMANQVDYIKAIEDEADDGLFVHWIVTTGPVYKLYIREINAGSVATALSGALSASTDYYLTIRRVEATGTYGTLYLDIYSDSARTSLVETVSLALTEKQDFRYLYAINTYNSGSNSEMSGFVENFADTVAGAYARVYKNAVGVGTERALTTTYTTYTENIKVSASDALQLYAKKGTGGLCGNSYVQNFKIKAKTAETSSVLTY